LLSLALVTGSALADQLKFARFHLLRGKTADTYELNVQLPLVVTGEGEVGFPEQCQEVSRNAQAIGMETSLTLQFRCSGPLHSSDQLTVPWGEDGGVLTSGLKAGGDTPVMLHGDEGSLVLPLEAEAMNTRPIMEVAAEYTQLGVTHILGGLDHLAFVLCLCLLTGGTSLLLLVTAFTLGHSISLALSFLGVVSIPVPPVEATIALSIAFMAREALLVSRDATDQANSRVRYRAVVVAFGLLHGLGFASVLGELGVSPGERIAGLIFFNLGVEIGQLMFVAVVLSLLWLARLARFDSPLRTAVLYGVGTLGMFWTYERVAGFVG